MKGTVAKPTSVRVCVCTSYPAYSEPRAPRHALALAELGKHYEIVFVDCLPYGIEQPSGKIFGAQQNITHSTCFFPYKRSHLSRFLLTKAQQLASRWLFRRFGYMHPSILSTRAVELEKMLERIDADVYIGYNIDTLIPIQRVRKIRDAITIFDCQEFYSDMGNGQTVHDRQIIAAIEQRYFSECDLILASSDEIADEIAKTYKVRRPLPLYNAPPTENDLSPEKEQGFSLYWRNTTIDLGQRGLGDAIAALTFLPDEIVLHIQGNLPADGGARLRDMITQLGLSHRVFEHPPYVPSDAVKMASHYTVGLCLEQATNRNQLLTVSNKMFDYLMAGLPVIASDVPGLRTVIERARAGFLYQAGNPRNLADKILQLYDNKPLLQELAVNARVFALTDGNLEHEMSKLRAAFVELLGGACEQAA